MKDGAIETAYVVVVWREVANAEDAEDGDGKVSGRTSGRRRGGKISTLSLEGLTPASDLLWLNDCLYCS